MMGMRQSMVWPAGDALAKQNVAKQKGRLATVHRASRLPRVPVDYFGQSVRQTQ
jgi:hypothetical protein